MPFEKSKEQDTPIIMSLTFFPIRSTLFFRGVVNLRLWHDYATEFRLTFTCPAQLKNEKLPGQQERSG